MNDVGVIDTFLNTFTSYIDSGFGLIKGEVTGLSSILIALDITLAGLFWAWGADEDVMRRLVRKTLAIGFFAWIIGNFNALAKIVFESFAGLGLKAGGSSISTAEFLRPGRLAEVGLTAGQPLLDAASQLTGPVALFVNAVQIAVLLVSWLLILIAFFILAVQLFVTLIEFKLTTLAGFVLIPFAFFGKTAFLAEKVLGNVVASGVKVMVLAVIVGIGSGLFSQFTTSYGDAQPTISQALSAVLAALALLGLGIFGPGIATGLITGAPQLGAGAARSRYLRTRDRHRPDHRRATAGCRRCRGNRPRCRRRSARGSGCCRPRGAGGRCCALRNGSGRTSRREPRRRRCIRLQRGSRRPIRAVRRRWWGWWCCASWGSGGNLSFAQFYRHAIDLRSHSRPVKRSGLFR